MSDEAASRQSPVVTVAAFIVVLAVTAGAGYLVYLGARDAPSVVGALVTALGAVLAVVAGRIYETRTRIEQDRRERMAPIYERLVKTFYSASGDRASTEEELMEFFGELAERLLIWGPEPIITAWVTWRAEATAHGGSPEALFAFERLIVAMRKDVGTKSGALARGDLLRVFINDMDDHMGDSSARPPGT